MSRFDYKYVAQLLNEAAREHMVACKNYVVLNISARVSKTFKRSLLGLPQQFKARDRNKIIEYSMRCMTRESTEEDEQLLWDSLTRAPTAATRAHVQSYTAQHLQEYAELPLDIGGRKPTKRVEKKWWLYLRWLYRTQQEIDAAPEESSSRSFSMLPLCSLQARYIMISNTTLHGLLKSLLGKEIPAQSTFIQQKREYWQK